MPQRRRADERDIDRVHAAERREHGAADEVGKTDAAEAADAVNTDRRAAPVLAEIIRDQRESDWCERRFAEAEPHARQHQLREGGGEARRDGAAAPQSDAEDQYRLAAVAIGIPAEGNGEEAVQEREGI